MLKAQGQAFIFNPAGPTEVSETVTCNHCQRVLFIPPGHDATAAGAICHKCHEVICRECGAVGGCDPWVDRKLA